MQNYAFLSVEFKCKTINHTKVSRKYTYHQGPAPYSVSQVGMFLSAYAPEETCNTRQLLPVPVQSKVELPESQTMIESFICAFNKFYFLICHG